MAEHAKEAPNAPSFWSFINPPANARRWLYGVLVAAQPLVVAYGLTSNETAALWLSFSSAVLGLGLAAANTPKN
jgi:hypothetical protein